MPDRSPDGPQPGGWVPPPADATRDITLPPLPDRPAPAVRPEWAPYVPPPGPTAPAQQDGAEPQADAEATRADAAPPRSPYDLPTDRFAPRGDHARSRTLAFQPPSQVQLLKVSVGARRRRGRWLWVVAILVPLLIILGSGVYLFLMFYGG